MQIAEALGIVGVNVFLLISGYFSIKPKKSSIINLVYCCFFYCLVSLAIGVCIGDFRPKSILFVSQSNWFIPNYLGLIILSPILNTYIEGVERKSFLRLTVILLLFDIWIDWFPGTVIKAFHGYRLLHFVVMYFCGRSIALYSDTISSLKKYIRFSWAVYLVATVILGLTGYMIQTMHIEKQGFYDLLWAYNNPLVLVSSVACFLMFLQIKIKDSRIINHIAKSVIAVLLFHACGVVSTIRHNFYDSIYNQYSGVVLVALWIASLFVIFAIATLIDQLRLYTFDKYIKKRI